MYIMTFSSKTDMAVTNMMTNSIVALSYAGVSALTHALILHNQCKYQHSFKGKKSHIRSQCYENSFDPKMLQKPQRSKDHNLRIKF